MSKQIRGAGSKDLPLFFVTTSPTGYKGLIPAPISDILVSWLREEDNLRSPPSPPNLDNLNLWEDFRVAKGT